MISTAATAVGFAVATAFWPGLLTAPLVARWSLLVIAVPLLLWSVPRLWVQGLSWRLGLFLSYAALSLLWTPNPLAGVWILVHLTIFAGVVLFVVQAGIANGRGMLYGMALGVAVQAPLVLLQAFNYSPLIEQAVPPSGLFLNRNLLVETAAPLLVYGLFSRMRLWILVLLGIIVTLAIDRAAFVGMAVVAWVALGKPWRRAVFLFIALCGLLALTVLSPWGMDSITNRLDIMTATFRSLVPWGTGIGSFTVLHQRWEFAHCDPLQMISEYGIGAILIFILVGDALRRSDSGFLPERAALGCLVVESFFSMPFEMPATAFLAAVLIGRLYSDGYRVRSLRPLCGIDPSTLGGRHA